jgi:hypothetical protein
MLLEVEISQFPTELSSRPERTRISYLAELATTTHAALRKEPHELYQHHQVRQEIRGSAAEGPAVAFLNPQ